MEYVIILIIILVVFLLVYPFKIAIFNKSEYLYINIGKLLVFRINLYGLLDKVKEKEIESAKSNKYIKQIKIKKIYIHLKGINFNYSLNGAYYGLLCSLLGFLKVILENNNVDFYYDLEYLGERSLEFNTIIRARAYRLISSINNI